MGSSRRTADDRGASLVEFALILPVLAMLLLGLISGGLALNDKQQMTHATREGARFGATISAEQGFSDGGSWASNVRALIVERSAGSLDAADICVSLVQGSPATVVTAAGKDATWFSTAAGQPCIAGQTYPISGTDAGQRVQVTAQKPATIELGVFGGHDVVLRSSATGKSEAGG